MIQLTYILKHAQLDIKVFHLYFLQFNIFQVWKTWTKKESKAKNLFGRNEKCKILAISKLT
jgi:hypothetical protein